MPFAGVVPVSNPRLICVSSMRALERCAGMQVVDQSFPLVVGIIQTARMRAEVGTLFTTETS